MTHIIIDRRKNDKGKSTPNRQKYVRRVREQVKEAVKDVIRDGNIKDVVDSKGKKIRIPAKGLNQPNFKHAPGGESDRVFPGNKEFNQGDRVNRPPRSGGGAGNEGSKDGEGEDMFEFHLTKDEFLDIFFEDLELPDLVKKDINKIDEWVYRRAGFSVDGAPSRLNIVRSLKQSKSRRLALRGPKKKQLVELQMELEDLIGIEHPTEEQLARIEEIRDQIEFLTRKIKAVPYIDDMDLRYNRWDKVPIPSTQAAMFCLMDVSASMGDWEKEMAKRFFMLLYLFLVRNYERVEIIFIRHTQVAKEVNEQEFFYSKETGGTVVSSSLQLMIDVIKDRYSPEQWNIFACQASDGDNWFHDSVVCQELLQKEILPIVQYFAYVEIDRRSGGESDLWPYYESVRSQNNNFETTVIGDVKDIYPVFRKLFEKKEAAA